MSVLILISESELRRFDILGSGAFGTVYKVCRLQNRFFMHSILSQYSFVENLMLLSNMMALPVIFSALLLAVFTTAGEHFLEQAVIGNHCY